MNLTINGLPIAVDQVAVEEIIRKHLQNGADDPRLGSLPDHEIAVPHLKRGEKFIGSYSGPDAKVTLAILLPGAKKNVTWQDAAAWAKDQGGDLPNRIEALLLFQHHRGEFEKEVYWTNEQCADASSCAWLQSFGGGDQYGWLKVSKNMARAARRVTI